MFETRNPSHADKYEEIGAALWLETSNILHLPMNDVVLAWPHFDWRPGEYVIDLEIGDDLRDARAGDGDPELTLALGNGGNIYVIYKPP